MGYLGLIEEDYEWITRHLVRIANTFCDGRVVSVLEGGYRIQGGMVSAFARSVAAHVRGLVEGNNHREGWSEEDVKWEEGLEGRQQESRVRKVEERMAAAGMMGWRGKGGREEAPVPAAEEGVLAAATATAAAPPAGDAAPAAAVAAAPAVPEPVVAEEEGGGGGRRKRRAASANVDYVALMKKMKEEEHKAKAAAAGGGKEGEKKG